MEEKLLETYLDILREELVPAMGCIRIIFFIHDTSIAFNPIESILH